MKSITYMLIAACMAGAVAAACSGCGGRQQQAAVGSLTAPPAPAVVRQQAIAQKERYAAYSNPAAQAELKKVNGGQ